jgi:hypothetical protein
MNRGLLGQKRWLLDDAVINRRDTFGEKYMIGNDTVYRGKEKAERRIYIKKTARIDG